MAGVFTMSRVDGTTFRPKALWFLPEPDPLAALEERVRRIEMALAEERTTREWFQAQLTRVVEKLNVRVGALEAGK